MKLLVREPGRLVFQLRARDRNSLRALLRLGAECRVHPPHFTRGPMGFVPADSDQMLRDAVQQHRVQSRESALGWLEDPARCVAGRGGFGLTLTEAEAETLLQALNGAKLGFWEALGRPDPEDPPISPGTAHTDALVYASELANAYIACLVDCLASGDTNG